VSKPYRTRAPRVKQQATSRKPSLVHRREAVIHPSQLGFVFTVDVNAVQASDAETHQLSATGAVCKPRERRTGAYSVMRYYR